MNHTLTHMISYAAILAFLSLPALAQTPTASMLANTCAGCHGTHGSSVGPASPSIAGISAEYFIESMEAYKNDERVATVMNRIAKGYSEEEIKIMAEYFAKQPMIRQKQKHDANKANYGSKLHKKYCEKCHEEGGRSSEDDAGILAGQWHTYLRFSMDDYISGTREMEKKMAKRVKKLRKEHGDEGVDALLHFYASQM
ncbi:c-type cytochrome [Kaarinaea lacus]